MISGLQLCLIYLYGIPLFILNLRTVYVLWTKRTKFSSSYYKLFLLSGCNDILLYVSNNLVFRLPNYQPLFDNFYSRLDEYSRWPSIAMFSVIFPSHFTHFGMLLLCLNRLTALIFYMSYETFWLKWTPFAVIFVSAASFILSFDVLMCRYIYGITERDGYRVVYLKPDAFDILWNSQMVTTIFVFVSTALELIVNIATIVIWKRRKAVFVQKNVTFQKNLVILTVVVYLIHLTSFIFNAFRSFFTNIEQRHLAYNIVSDMVALLPNCVIVIVSPSFRTEVMPEWIKYVLRSIRDKARTIQRFLILVFECRINTISPE